MKRGGERIEAVWIHHLDVKVEVNAVRTLSTISGLTVLAQPLLGPLCAPLWGSGPHYSLLGPSVSVPGLVSKSPQPWPSLDQAHLPVRAQPWSQSLSLPSSRGFPQWPCSPSGLCSGTGLSAQPGNSPGLQFSAHRELLAHTSIIKSILKRATCKWVRKDSSKT